MADKDLAKLGDRGMKAWSDRDADAFMALLADRFEWQDDTHTAPMRTETEAREYMQAWFTAFPDLKVKTLNRVIGDDSISAEIEFAGTNTGPLEMGGQRIPATNRSITGHGTYFAKVRDGRMTEFHSHPNVAEMMRQLGLGG